jgi:hypothetical protein
VLAAVRGVVVAVVAGTALPMAAAVDMAAAATPETVATGTAMPPVHMAAAMPTTGSTRYTMPKRPPTSATMTASPHSQVDYMPYYCLRSSSLLGSPSTTVRNNMLISLTGGGDELGNLQT